MSSLRKQCLNAFITLSIVGLVPLSLMPENPTVSRLKEYSYLGLVFSLIVATDRIEDLLKAK